MIEGSCWLCRVTGPLTEEHTPPKSAFNGGYVRLHRVSEEHRRKGVLVWEPGQEYRKGYARPTLCAICNQLAGRSFAPSYRELCERLAPAVLSAGRFSHVQLPKLRNLQRVLRQVLFQFVSANGPKFIRANPWLRDLLLERKSCPLPTNVHVYLFAVQQRTLKRTGVSGHIESGGSCTGQSSLVRGRCDDPEPVPIGEARKLFPDPAPFAPCAVDVAPRRWQLPRPECDLRRSQDRCPHLSARRGGKARTGLQIQAPTPQLLECPVRR